MKQLLVFLVRSLRKYAVRSTQGAVKSIKKYVIRSTQYVVGSTQGAVKNIYNNQLQTTNHRLQTKNHRLQTIIRSTQGVVKSMKKYVVRSTQGAVKNIYNNQPQTTDYRPQTKNHRLPTKKHITQLLLTIYCVLLTAITTHAQTYPVQVSTQLIPPYSLKLADYQTTSSEKLFVNLLLTDVAVNNRQVRLKMYIEGQGLNIQSNELVVGAQPLYLDGGILQRLSNLDLQPYFDIANLQGISPTQYSNILPAGMYNFCFEVYDFNSGQRLSQKSCAMVVLIQNDPPFLNLPYNQDVVSAQLPQNIIFNWTPRHLNATNVQYEFTLKELLDNGISTQDAFMTSPILYQTTVYPTTLVYGPAEIPLLEGKTYGWQVRAFVSDGISETSVFRNNGLSEIFSFTYEANCEPPSYVMSEANSSQTVHITWDTSDHIVYNVQYRKEGYSDADWFEEPTYNNQVTIHNLEAGTVYDFRVGGKCTEQGGFSYSQIQQFTTPTEDETTAYYNCGVMPTITITNQDPLPNIGVNQTFTAGDFPVTVKEVQGNNGTYTGWGYIIVPYLADTKIRVEFTGIHLNTDYQLTEGIVETSYDEEWGDIGNVNELIEEFTGDNGDLNQYDASNMDIASVTVDANGNVTIIDEDGVEHPIDTELPVTITDQNGDQWTVNEDGTITQGHVAAGGAPTADNTNGVNSSGEVTQISSQDVQIVFEPSGYYNTDQLNSEVQDVDFISKYQSIPTASGSNYLPLYKAVSNAPQSTDIVTATATFSNGKTKDDIVFKTKTGTAVAATWSGNTATLSIKKQFDFVKEDILATVKPADSTGKYDIAGKLNLWHLKQENVNVTIVPVNNAQHLTESEYTTQVNAIYEKAGVHFNITLADNIAISNWDIDTNGTFDIAESGLLSNYTAEEKGVYNYYKNQVGVTDQMYYLFLVQEPTNHSDVLGFMPLKRQYGFVFSQDSQARTLAHELGHGVFGLQHYDDPETTNLLMHTTYTTGTAFTHMDWKKIHAPGLLLYWFQGDDSGAQISNSLFGARFIEAMRARIYSENHPDPVVPFVPFPVEDSIAIQELPTVILYGMATVAHKNVFGYESFKTTDGLNIAANIIFSPNKKYNIERFISNLSDNNCSTSVGLAGTFKKFYSPNSSSCGQLDSQTQNLLRMHIGYGSSTYDFVDGVLFEFYGPGSYNNFKTALIDFKNDIDLEDQWLNTVNQNIINKNYNEIKKYGPSVLSLINNDAKKSLLEDLINSNVRREQLIRMLYYSSPIAAGNAEFLVDYEKSEIIINSLIKSLITHQTKVENTAFLTEFITKKYYTRFNHYKDNDLKFQLYNIVGMLALRANKNSVYTQIKSLIDNPDKDKSELITALLTGLKRDSDKTNELNVLDYFNNNPDKLSSVSSSLEDNSYFAALITQMAKENYFNSFLATQAYAASDYETINQAPDLSTTALQYIPSTNFNVSGYSMFTECGGAVQYNCTKQYNDLPEEYHHTADKPYYYAIKYQGLINVAHTNIVYYSAGKPLSTFINLYFDHTVPSLNIAANTTVTLPLFYAKTLTKKYQHEGDVRMIRIGLQTLAVLSSIPSGGASLEALAIFTISSGALIVTVFDDEIYDALGTEDGQILIDTINEIDLIVNLPGLANSAFKFVSNSGETILKFKNISKALVRLSKDKIARLKPLLKITANKFLLAAIQGGRIEGDIASIYKTVTAVNLASKFTAAASGAKIKLVNNFRAAIIANSIEYNIATTTLNASQTALRFEPLANVIHLSDDAAALAGYTKLGTIEEVYVAENGITKLEDVAIYKNADDVLAWRGLAQAVVNIPTTLAAKLGNTLNIETWLVKYADEIADATPLLNQLDNSIASRNVLTHLEDAQGRLVTVIERPGQSNLVSVIHKDVNGTYKLTEFSPAYNPSLNPNIPVPLSANKLTPDFSTTQYMHPLNQGKTIKIKMSGNRTTDFARARAELGITKADEIGANGQTYTWHHLDDFDPVTGECTMQLVESSAHQGTGVTGMQHSGSVAQWRAYYGNGY